MLVYHGSVLELRNPDTKHSKQYLDFGKGFYVTTYQAQAEKWALRKGMRSNKVPVVNVYCFDENAAEVLIKKHLHDDEVWLDFVCDCRSGIVMRIMESGIRQKDGYAFAAGNIKEKPLDFYPFQIEGLLIVNLEFHLHHSFPLNFSGSSNDTFTFSLDRTFLFFDSRPVNLSFPPTFLFQC